MATSAVCTSLAKTLTTRARLSTSSGGCWPRAVRMRSARPISEATAACPLPPPHSASYNGSVAAETLVRRDSSLDRRFALSSRRTDRGTEVRAGLTTFIVMSYIIIVNPVVLTTGARIAGLDVSFPAVVTSTCLVAGLMTLLMGLWANLPFALAPGLGINAVVAFQLMVGLRYSFAEAMGVILVEGLIITILVLTGLRQMVLH